MITLNQIAYNIQDLMYPNTLTLEGETPITQIKFWIHYHRAKLIQENVSKGILNSTNLYQRIENPFQPLQILDFTSNSSHFSDSDLNAYGIGFKKEQDRGSWRNTGYIKKALPKIVSTPNDSSIKNIEVRRQVYDYVNERNGPVSGPIVVYKKSLSEKQYGEFNKFTNNNNPYYFIDTDSNATTNITVSGLQHSPNNLGDLDTPVAEELYWHYSIRCDAIFENPTEATHYGGDDEEYPIPADYIKDLIERVVAVEGNTVLKTMQNES